MGVIGQIVASRAGSQRAYALLLQRPLASSSGPAPAPAFEHTTAADTLAGTSGDAELLSGLESWSGSLRGSAGEGVGSGFVVPGMPGDPAAGIHHTAPLQNAGQRIPGMVDVPLAQADEALRSLRSMAAGEVRLLRFVEAAD
ncbi:hypothetical protein J7I86_15220, partial [Arthrobacter sp. ISL-95]|nr:hypothetical protein [Arthrobacter sp. ISL-95]